MKRQPHKGKELLEKAEDSALLAVEIYNKPRISFRSGGFIVFMSIAWLALFHAIFERKGIKYFYRKNGRFVIIDGERKAWELGEYVKKYYKEQNNPIRKNLDFFIKLRNKIEHRIFTSIRHRYFWRVSSNVNKF
jgi:ABC-type ATPase with predicted acetyltransferase domain